MIFQVPVPSEHVRSFKDPNQPRIRIIHALPRVDDLPSNIPIEPDPRVPKAKGPVIERISRSLKSNDGRFHLLNRGITISAKEVEFDNKRNVLKLNIPDDEAYGIIDGGHTYKAITEAVGPMSSPVAKSGPAALGPLPISFDNQYVHLEVLVGIETHLLIPMKVVTDSDLIPVSDSDAMPVAIGAKRRWPDHSGRSDRHPSTGMQF